MRTQGHRHRHGIDIDIDTDIDIDILIGIITSNTPPSIKLI